MTYLERLCNFLIFLVTLLGHIVPQPRNVFSNFNRIMAAQKSGPYYLF